MEVVLILVLVEVGQSLRLVVLLYYFPLAEDDLCLLLESNIGIENHFHVLTDEISLDFLALLASLRVVPLVDEVPQIVEEYFLFRSAIELILSAA